MSEPDRRRCRLLAWALAVGGLLLGVLGLAAGSGGWLALGDAGGAEWRVIVWEIRAPRTLGAWLAGALLGLAGALAQGLFRNPLADPYLLGSAAGASLAVVLVLAAGAGLGSAVAGSAGGLGALGGFGAGLAGAPAVALADLGLVTASFLGAAVGMLLTLTLARGAAQTTRLLLAGVVVGVLLTAVSDLVTLAVPDALRGRQGFMLGNTAFLGWAGAGWMAAGLLVSVATAWRLARVLDALTLGEDSARSLGLDLPRLRGLLVGVLALATGLAVSQVGLVAFVGLASPHLVRRFAPAPHAFTLVASAAAGGALLLLADVLARTLMAPQELPVGVLTAIVGGGYLLRLLHRKREDA